MPQLSPGDALAEQARQLAAAHAQQQVLHEQQQMLREEAQQASEVAYRSKLEADRLRTELEHAKAYRVKAREATREVQLLQQELDRMRARAAGANATAAPSQSAVCTAEDCARLRQQLAGQRTQQTASCACCEDLKRSNSWLRQQLCVLRGAATPGEAGRLAELQQEVAHLRGKLAGVAAAAAMTQPGPPSAGQQQQQQQQQEQLESRVHVDCQPQVQQSDQQPLQQLQPQHILQAAEPAADGDDTSTDTTRATCTLPTTSPDRAAAAQLSLQLGGNDSVPASPARTPAPEQHHQDTPCSKLPRSRATAAQRLSTAAVCEQHCRGSALPQHQATAASGRTPSAAPPAGQQLPAVNAAAAVVQQNNLLAAVPASVPGAQRSSHWQDGPLQQHHQRPAPAEVWKGWRQKRKAGCTDDMLASQQAPSLLRSAQRTAQQSAAQPSTPHRQPAAPGMVLFTPPEQRQAQKDAAQLTAPETVACASPPQPAACPPVADALIGAAPPVQPGEMLQQQPQDAQGQRQDQTSAQPAAQQVEAQPAALITPPGRKRRSGPMCEAVLPAHANYKFTAVVRGKAAREALQAGDCIDCREWYEALESWDKGVPIERPPCGHLPAAAVPPVQRAPAAAVSVLPPPRAPANGRPTRRQMLQDAGRHRWYHAPPATPDGYWDMGFMDSLDSRVPQ